MPPGAPEAGEAAIEDLREGAGDAGEVPGVRAEKEDLGARESEGYGEEWEKGEGESAGVE